MIPRCLRLLPVIFVLGACGGRAGSPPSGAAIEPPQVEPPQMAVRVTNHHRSIVSVTAVTRGTARRLGFVERNSAAVFVLPREVEGAAAVEITVQSLATGALYSTGAIPAESCALIELTVAWDLASSGLWPAEP